MALIARFRPTGERRTATAGAAYRSSYVNWGAIFAGSFIALSISVILSLFAVAVGIVGLNVVSPFPATSVGGAIYSIAMVAVSSLIGGYSTSKLGGISDSINGALHGSAAWAVVAVALALGASMLTNIFAFTTTGFGWTMFLSALFGAVSAAAGGAKGVSPAMTKATPAEVGTEAQPPVVKTGRDGRAA